jgi:glutathione S-transferase
VLNRHLADRDWLADEYSIADMANWSWIWSHKWARVPKEGLAHLERWMAVVAACPGCQRGVNVPPPKRTADQTKASGAFITIT